MWTLRPVRLDTWRTHKGRFVMALKSELNPNWRDIPDYPGYRVSSQGTILSLKSNKLLKPLTSRSGHQHVFLYDGHGRSDKIRIHRAVLLVFVGPCPQNCECRHLDGNPENNTIENLKWGTKQENVNDRRRHGRMPIPHESIFTKLIPADIPRIRHLKEQGYSSRQVGKMYGTSHTTILQIWRGNRWKGY